MKYIFSPISPVASSSLKVARYAIGNFAVVVEAYF